MRELVEIGPGKIVARGWRLSEVALVPTRRTLDIDPYQEDVYRTLIQVHGELGQLGQAKAWYELCSRRMSGELDIDVSPDVQRVFQRMMRVRAPEAVPRSGA